MFENSWRVNNSGVKYKKNPRYKLQDIKMLKIENIPKGLKEDEYSKLVDSDFVGKLVIEYDKDKIGQSGCSPRWCYVYDCNKGQIKYMGTAIHKSVDYDHLNQNYNEKLYAIIGDILFDSNLIKIPKIDLVKNIGYEEDKPAVLSYNIVQRNNGQELEEMIMMETIAYNMLERQEIRSHRIPIDILLESVKIQVMKKVGYEKDFVKKKIENKIIDLKIAEETNSTTITANKEEQMLLNIIKDNIDSIDKNTTTDSFLKEISQKCGREVLEDEITGIKLGDANVKQLLSNIKNIAVQKDENYQEIRKSIVQATTIDLMTNNIDRHLNNWALIRNKKTDKYKLGLFDHGEAFFNMALKEENPFFSQEYLKEHWALSSVLVSNTKKQQISQSDGIDVFKYLMANYREDTLEILQKLYNSLPQIKKEIEYETIPKEEFLKLPPEQSKNYVDDLWREPVKPDKLLNGLNSKFKKIRHDYNIDFKEQDERI